MRFQGLLDRALDKAREAPAVDWTQRANPTEWVKAVGPVVMVVHPTYTAPAAIDRTAKLTVFVGAEGGLRIEALVVWAQTIVAARQFGDRLIAAATEEAGQ
jgi:hypothetical protein